MNMESEYLECEIVGRNILKYINNFFRPLAGSLTEARGQKANIHVLREMLELCQIIDSEGYVVKDEPTMRVIPFGELFNVSIYF